MTEYNMVTMSQNIAKKVMQELRDNGLFVSRWIPVSEGLPEERYAVLVWCPERKNTYCAYLDKGQWWIFGAYFQKVELDVEAWMSLPEPYEPQESDNLGV